MMQVKYTVLLTWARIETRLAGHLTHDVRRNMHIELRYALIFGFFQAVLQFVPVILRRLGATPEILAVYGSQSYLALILTGPTLVLMHRRPALKIMVICWLLSRSLFVPLSLANDVSAFLFITVGFSMLEYIPGPVYARIIQKVYPAKHRGQVMSIVRVGLASSMVVATPIAGRILDQYGYQVLFPLAAVAGVSAALIFSRMHVDQRSLLPERTHSLAFVWQIPRQDHRFAVYLLGMTAFGLGALVGTPFYPLVQVDRLQLSYSEIGWLALVQSFLWMASYYSWGRRVDRQGGIRVLEICAMLNALVPLIYIFAQNFWMLLPAFIALGLTNAGTDIGFINTAIQLADPDRVPEYAATHSMVMGIRGIVGLFLGVVLHNLGMSLAMIFALGVTFNLVAVVLWRWVYNQAKKAAVAAQA